MKKLQVLQSVVFIYTILWTLSSSKKIIPVFFYKKPENLLFDFSFILAHIVGKHGYPIPLSLM